VLAQLRRARRAQLRRRLIACAALLLGLALATPLLVEATLMLARFAAQAVALLLLQPYDPVGWATATLVGLLFLKRSIGARR
jgi:hypothetical protein